MSAASKSRKLLGRIMSVEDPLVPAEDFAAEFKISMQTLYNWHGTGKAPRAHKIGRRLFFRRSDIERWLATRAEPEPVGRPA
jgi:predicted DNA-binding transcriptional regulator AlpA